MKQETYYYGQGKVFLAERDPVTGMPGVYRWIGDCDALSLALEVESFDHKESYSGQRASVRRLYTGKEGTLSSTWYDRSPENVALVLYGQAASVAAGTVTAEKLPGGIVAGSLVALAYQGVSNVVIGSLVEGTDYTLHADVGSVEFLKTPVPENGVPLTANYSYGDAVNTSMFTQNARDVALRYEGVNLAEGGKRVILELYKIQLDPVSAMDWINTDTSLSGLETSAGVLVDTLRKDDPVIGRYGRVIHVGESL